MITILYWLTTAYFLITGMIYKDSVKKIIEDESGRQLSDQLFMAVWFLTCLTWPVAISVSLLGGNKK